MVALWVCAFVPAVFGAAALPHELKGGGFGRADAPSAVALRELQRRLPVGVSRVTVVFTSDRLDARGGAFQRLEEQALAGITPQAVPGLLDVQTLASTGASDLVSLDGHASLAVLDFKTTLEETQGQVGRLRELLRPTALRAAITGEPALYDDMERVVSHDIKVAEGYTLPLALLVLVLVFGSLVAAGLPVAGGGMAVTVTLGLLALLARAFDFSFFMMNTATMLGLAVGIDYSLFMVGRFREELGRGRPVPDAVEVTVARAGRSIFFSGLTVFVGMAGLLIYRSMVLRSIGIGGSLVVFFSVLAALTLLPALLGMLGPRVDALRLLGRHEGGSRFWERWSGWVMAHPVGVLICTCAFVLVLAWPALRLQVDVPDASVLPTSTASRQGFDTVQRHFDPGVIGPTNVLLTWPATGPGAQPLSGPSLERAWAYARRLQALPGVKKVTSVVTLPGVSSAAQAARFWKDVEAPNGGGAGGGGRGLGLLGGLFDAQTRLSARRLAAATTAPGAILFLVSPDSAPASPRARELAVRIRELAPPPGARVSVSGVSADVQDFVADLSGQFPWIVLFVVGTTFVVLLFFARSIVLPVKAVVVNSLAVLAAYGVLVWLFQWGHLEGPLGFTATGYLDATLPVLLFCSVFGISMDYEVFLVTRMREAWLETGDNVAAVRFGLVTTGRIITSAALIIVVVTGSFAFTSIVVTKAIGVGLAVAVGLDATVVRVLLVPAVMRLLGRWNWYLPAWLDRVLPRVGE